MKKIFSLLALGVFLVAPSLSHAIIALPEDRLPAPREEEYVPITATLRKGMQHNQIYHLQRCLIRLGYLPGGTPNGLIAETTDRAVKRFQEDNGLGNDGIVGRRTRAVLNRLCGTPGNPVGTPAALQTLIDTTWPQPCNGSGSTECGSRKTGSSDLGRGNYYIWAILPTFDDSRTSELVSAIAHTVSGGFAISYTFPTLHTCRSNPQWRQPSDVCP